MVEQAEKFLEQVLQVLNPSIVETLQELEGKIPIVVVGGKAMEVLLKRKYTDPTPTLDWDLNVWGNNAVTNEKARDFVGELILESLGTLCAAQRFQLDLITKHYGGNFISKFVYEVNPEPFITATGERYHVGHVDIITEKFGQQGLVDIVNIRHADQEYLKIDGVNYLDLKELKNTLEILVAAPDYPKKAKALRRLRLINDAVRENGLSCNYYNLLASRSDYVGQVSKRNLYQCERETIYGVRGPKLGIGTHRIFPRFNISVKDVKSHEAYYQTLSKKTRKTLMSYTKDYSSECNIQLAHNFFNPDEKETLDPKVRAINQAIINAPATQEDMLLFRTSRYIFHPKELVAGDLERLYTFTSTTFDNQLNPFPFMDIFSPCCVHVIKVPKGSQGLLILDKNSYFPQEHEVLLSYDCKLKIAEARYEQVAYYDTDDGSKVWFNEMQTYFSTLVYNSPLAAIEEKVEEKGETGEETFAAKPISSMLPPKPLPKNLDVSFIKNLKQYNVAVEDPKLAALLAKLLAY